MQYTNWNHHGYIYIPVKELHLLLNSEMASSYQSDTWYHLTFVSFESCRLIIFTPQYLQSLSISNPLSAYLAKYYQQIYVTLNNSASAGIALHPGSKQTGGWLSGLHENPSHQPKFQQRPRMDHGMFWGREQGAATTTASNAIGCHNRVGFVWGGWKIENLFPMFACKNCEFDDSQHNLPQISVWLVCLFWPILDNPEGTVLLAMMCHLFSLAK